MNETRKLKLQIAYAFFIGVLMTATAVISIKAFSAWYQEERRMLSKEDIERGQQLRDAEGLNSHGSRSRAPYVMFRPEVNHRTMPITNSFGFHSPEIAKAKPPDEYRIAIVGGSVAFTSGPQDPNAAPTDTRYLNHSIIAQLATVLSERLPGLAGKKVTFINAGIASAVSGQELSQLLHHVIPVNIDLLIVYDGFNDFYEPFNYDRRPGYPYDYIVEEYRFSEGRNGIGGKDALQNMDKMYRELGIQLPPVSEAKGKVLEQYLFNIVEMAAVAEHFGIPTGIFLQPYSERNMNPLLSDGNRHTIKLYQAAKKVFALLAKDNNSRVVFHDMTDMNKKLDRLFIDIAHTWWNPSHQMIAEEMFRHLDAAGVFDHLKGNTARLSNGESSPRPARPARRYDLIEEVLVAAGAGLDAEFSDRELAQFEAIGHPGAGDMAIAAIRKHYGSAIPSHLNKELAAETAKGRILDQRQDGHLEKPAKVATAERDNRHNAPILKDVDLSGDLCIKGVPFSGGDHKNSYVAALAFDDDKATIWASSQIGPAVKGAAYIGYDFGARNKHAIRRVSLTQGGRVEQIRIQSKISANAQWVDVATAATHRHDGRDIIDLVPSPAARYWRLLAASNAGDAPAAWTVYEIQLMEKRTKNIRLISATHGR